MVAAKNLDSNHATAGYLGKRAPNAVRFKDFDLSGR